MASKTKAHKTEAEPVPAPGGGEVVFLGAQYNLPPVRDIWKAIAQWERQRGKVANIGRVNNLMVPYPGGKIRLVSLTQAVEALFGTRGVNEAGNGAYHPRQAASVLRSVGYIVPESPGNTTPSALTKACACGERLPHKANFCWACGSEVA